MIPEIHSKQNLLDFLGSKKQRFYNVSRASNRTRSNIFC